MSLRSKHGYSGGRRVPGSGCNKNTKVLGQEIVGIFKEHQRSSCGWNRVNEKGKRNRVKE